MKSEQCLSHCHKDLIYFSYEVTRPHEERSLFSTSGSSDNLKSEDAEGGSLEINLYVTDLKLANVPS